MRVLVKENLKVFKMSYLESLDEVWGDWLLVKVLIRVGIYLDERYVYLFNGELLRRSKIRGDRMCFFILSFYMLF